MTPLKLPDNKKSIEHVLYIGAGSGQALDQILAAEPACITLVEPDYENLISLRIATAGNKRINIIEAAVFTDQTDNTFLRFNFPDLNTLCQPTGIRRLFPNLKLIQETTVKVIHPVSLVNDLGLSENSKNLLIIEAAGAAMSILVALEDAGLLSLFHTIRVQAGHIPRYENETPISLILEWLSLRGYCAAPNFDTRDPDQPVLTLSQMPKSHRSALAQFETALSKLQKETQVVEDRKAALVSSPKPVLYSLHHFACTGGSLITRSLAAQPDVIVLSEVDPFSPMLDSQPKYAPSDLIRLLKSNPTSTPTGLIEDVFLDMLESISGKLNKVGKSLLLRDHSHAHFCETEAQLERPLMRTMLLKRFKLSSIITVRHPLDSYLSMRKQGWGAFEPKTLEEYSRRYLMFLDAYKGLKFETYERFVGDPDAVTQDMCKQLGMNYSANWQEKLEGIHVTGNSGRRGLSIRPRPRRLLPNKLITEMKGKMHNYRDLCTVLEYLPDGVNSA